LDGMEEGFERGGGSCWFHFVLENGPGLVDVYLCFDQRMIYKLPVALRRFVSAEITRTTLYIKPLQTAPKRVSCHSDSVHSSPPPFFFHPGSGRRR